MKWVSALLAASVMSGPSIAQTPPAALASPPADVTIPNSRVIDFVSSVNGHRYRINVALPLQPPPPKGHRVLYLFDGNAYFSSVTEAVRINGNAPDVVVVGIGYPDSLAFAAESDARHQPPTGVQAALDPVTRARARERTYDLSLPMSGPEIAAQAAPKPAPYTATDVGGIDELLRTIEADVKPRVAAMTKVDASNQVLFGHSLGGLTVLRALFTEPGAFRTFIVASPSIWWNNRAVLAGEAAFVAAVKVGKAAPRVLITVGANESSLPRMTPPGTDLPALTASFARSNMVGNARELAARLQAVKGPAGYEVGEFASFPDQGHGISVWPAIGRAVEFAFQR